MVTSLRGSVIPRGRIESDGLLYGTPSAAAHVAPGITATAGCSGTHASGASPSSSRVCASAPHHLSPASGTRPFGPMHSSDSLSRLERFQCHDFKADNGTLIARCIRNPIIGARPHESCRLLPNPRATSNAIDAAESPKNRVEDRSSGSRSHGAGVCGDRWVGRSANTGR